MPESPQIFTNAKVGGKEKRSSLANILKSSPKDKKQKQSVSFLCQRLFFGEYNIENGEYMYIESSKSILNTNFLWYESYFIHRVNDTISKVDNCHIRHEAIM